ncbi:MAG: cytochrome c5 family protein [Granulosicoccus sp.]
MSGATDNGMVKIMGIVMGCLTVFALVCVFAARMLGVGHDDSADPMMRNALLQRIQPVAAVRTSADDLAAADTVVAMADAPAKSGEELVNGACAACHVAGVAGAPKLDDEAAWAERRELGLDALVASVINGKGSMPARGGSTYTDEEIRLAVQTIALFEVEDSAAAPEVPAAAPTEVADDANTATENAEEAVAAITDDASAGEEAMAALVVGEVPEGVTANIESAVNGICASCHMAGVAGAPKTGDKVAWQERADKGLTALTTSVINGLNVMPARGGSQLTDEEIPIAIQYLMSK